MTKHKVSELEGALLDAAVAMAWGEPTAGDLWLFGLSFFDELRPSTNWAHGGPIIERDHICLQWQYMKQPPTWDAWVEFTNGSEVDSAAGPTPLIAAMRCYVSSKFGEWVELP